MIPILDKRVHDRVLHVGLKVATFKNFEWERTFLILHRYISLDTILNSNPGRHNRKCTSADIAKEWQLRASALSRSPADSLLIADGCDRKITYSKKKKRSPIKAIVDAIEKTDFRDACTIGSLLVTDLRTPIITLPSVYHEVTRMTRYRGQLSVFHYRGPTDPKDGIHSL